MYIGNIFMVSFYLKLHWLVYIHLYALLFDFVVFFMYLHLLRVWGGLGSAFGGHLTPSFGASLYASASPDSRLCMEFLQSCVLACMLDTRMHTFYWWLVRPHDTMRGGLLLPWGWWAACVPCLLGECFTQSQRTGHNLQCCVFLLYVYLTLL